MTPGHTHLFTDSVALSFGPPCHSPLSNNVDLCTGEGGDSHTSLEEDGMGVGGIWGESHCMVGGVKVALAGNQFQYIGDGSAKGRRRGGRRGGERAERGGEGGGEEREEGREEGRGESGERRGGRRGGEGGEKGGEGGGKGGGEERKGK